MRLYQSGNKNWLVDLVCLVCLVDLVHLVGFVQPKNQTHQTDQLNKASWQAFSASCPGRAVDQPPNGSL
jgi:hypothetical protein